MTKERAVHTYAELWHASRCVLEAGTCDEKGSAWQFLSSALLTAFTFEAYLNHIGPYLTDWESIERLPPLEKLDLVAKLLSISFKKDSRPLQTIIELFDFRNTLAHGRTETATLPPTLRDINDNLDKFVGERPLLHWERLIQTDAFAKRARDDVEAVLKKLHEQRPEPKEPLFMSGVGVHTAQALRE